MADNSPHEIVLLYDDREQVRDDIHFADFEAVLEGHRTFKKLAGSRVRAAYCLIGNGLVLRSIVFFVFEVTESGKVDESFNLPLRYMALQAGAADDLGHGPVRKASRAQCPVPWHAVNLWEPSPATDGDGEVSAIELAQKRIYRNKLKLKPVLLGCDDAAIFAEVDADAGETWNLGAAPMQVTEASAPQAQHFNAKLAELFGEAGKLSLQDLIRMHADQLDLAQAKYRTDIETQQMAYLDQLRLAREEIHQLKVALRQEQGRNRRLQQMLRGDL